MLPSHVHHTMIYGWSKGRVASDGVLGIFITRLHQVEMGGFDTFYTFWHLLRDRRRDVTCESRPIRTPYYDLELVYGSRRVGWCARRLHEQAMSG
jgi:hypothetical protein